MTMSHCIDLWQFCTTIICKTDLFILNFVIDFQSFIRTFILFRSIMFLTAWSIHDRIVLGIFGIDFLDTSSSLETL